MFHGKGANLLTILNFTLYTEPVMLVVYLLIIGLLLLSLVVHDGVGPACTGAASCHYVVYDTG